jgi:hypothetical protein
VTPRRVALGLAVVAVAFGSAVTAPTITASPLKFSRPIKLRSPGPNANQSYGGVSCPSRSLCVATDGTPRIVTSTHPSGRPRDWILAPIGSAGYITEISCPSARLCVASGADDNTTGLYTSLDPAAGAGTWAFGGIDFDSVISGVSCPSIRLCVAVDESGDVLTSTLPAAGAGAWVIGAVDLHGLGFLSVSCSSVRLCVAVDIDGAIFTSIDPALGASTWHRTRGRSSGLFDVSCPTRRLCVAVGAHIIVSTRPNARHHAWHRIRRPPHGVGTAALRGVACATAHLCVAADDAGLVFVSTSPASGGWQTIRVHRFPRVLSNIRVGCTHAGRPLCVVAATQGWLVVGRARRR